jgi:competence ComEA-like helix-hairpin-helix protein
MKMLNLIAATALSIALAGAAFAQAPQPSSPSRSTTPPPAAGAPSKPSTAPSAQGSAATQGALVDINSAPKEELDKLKGVGPARAEAIVQNRPYKTKTDLKTRKIIPENVYNDIQDKIVARQGSASSTSSGSSAPAPSASGTTSGSAKKQ